MTRKSVDVTCVSDHILFLKLLVDETIITVVSV